MIQLWNLLDVSQIIPFFEFGLVSSGPVKYLELKHLDDYHLFLQKVSTIPCYLQNKVQVSESDTMGSFNLVWNKIFSVISDSIFPCASFWNTASDFLSRHTLPKSKQFWLEKKSHLGLQIWLYLQNSSWYSKSNSILSVFLLTYTSF